MVMVFQAFRAVLAFLGIGILCGFGALGCDRPSRAESGPIPPVSGEVLFKAKTCYTCHSIGQGRVVGPDLKGLFSRRDEAWVRRYLSDPVAATQSDPIAISLKEQFKAQMPKIPLTPQELDLLLTYLKAATQ